MSQLIRYATEIVEQVGARPAASDGEHEASKLIQERFLELGLDTVIEEFNSPTAGKWVRAIYYLAATLAGVLFFFSPSLAIIALLLALFSAAMLATDLLGKNPLLGLIGRGASQNVVARYVPLGEYDRRRKIIVVAHYDAGRTQVQGVKVLARYYNIIRLITWISVLVIFIAVAGGMLPLPEIITQIFAIIALIAGIISFVAALLQVANNFTPYGSGANSNASGVAALFGVAERLLSGKGGSSRVQTRMRTSRATISGSNGSDSDDASGVKSRSNTSRARQRAGTLLGGDIAGGAGATRGKRNEQASSESDFVLKAQLDSGSRADSSTNGERLISSRDATREFDAVSDETSEQNSTRLAAGVQTASSIGDGFVQLSESERNFAPGLRVPSDAIRVRSSRTSTDAESEVASEQKPKVVAGKADVPEWFAAAKKKAAEKEAARRSGGRDERPIARSQFADVPLGTDAVIPSSLTKSATIQKNQEKDALLREALRRGADKDASEPDATKLAEELSGDENASSATSATPTTPTASAVQADTKRGAQAQDGLAKESNIDPANHPTAHADFRGLDQSAFSVVGQGGIQESAIVPTASSASLSPSAPVSGNAEPEDAAMLQSTTLPVDTEYGEIAPLQIQLPLITDESEHRSQSTRLTSIPSLLNPDSVAIPAQQAILGEDFIAKEDYLPDENSLVSRTGSFAPLGATGTFAPVSNELLNYHENEADIYVDDVDDVSDADNLTGDDSYAPTPHLASIPSSRARSFFGNLGDKLSGHKKQEELEDSPTSWLGVEDDFEARKAGGEIGTWDNFSDEDDSDWKGGAYGGSPRENRAAVSALSTELINHEVWLVALGSQEAENSGIKALLAAHSGELRNAKIINLDSVGAGGLCYTTNEGVFKSAKTDHRLQNLAASAAQAVGLQLDQTKFSAYQTDAAAALSLGAHAISIIGLEGTLPIAWQSKTDTIDILQEDTIQSASELVFEMILNS